MRRNQATSQGNPNVHGDWKTLYRAAILETNKNVIPQKVSQAEQAVLARGRELFYGEGTPEEKEALEEALYALRAFRSAWEHAEAA
jgi:predicted RNA methylase